MKTNFPSLVITSFLEDVSDTLFNQGYLRLNNCHLHYRWSALISFWFIILFAYFNVMQLQYWGVIGSGLFAGFFSMVFNAVREGWLQYKGGKDNGRWKVPFSYIDVRFGMYGGLHAGLIAGYIVTLLNK